MPHPQLDNLVRSGDLKTESGDASEFDGLVASATRRLRDADNATLSLDSRFDLLYNASHALSLAALRWHGYRPAKNNTKGCGKSTSNSRTPSSASPVSSPSA